MDALPANDWLLNAPLACGLAVCSIAIYVRGWRVLRGKSAATRDRFSSRRLVSFLLAWIVVLIALASPLDPLGQRMLSVHMVQHMLLTMIAPPLFWFAFPAMPMLFGVGARTRTAIAAPILASSISKLVLRTVGHPVVGWSSLALVTVAWHMPEAYAFALRDPFWHQTEHLTMFGAGLLFWLCIVAPFPYRRRWPRIALVPYLVAADLVNTAVAAYLAFSSTPAYGWYAEIGPAFGTDALRDQQLAAGLMWVPGSVLYLGGAMYLTVRSLVPSRATPRVRTIALRVLPTVPEARESDLLQVPLFGRMFRSSRARLALRCTLLVLVLLIVLDGLLGSPDAPMNLAGTIPWTHWRGVAIIAILAVGNVACMACPLLAPRTLLRKWIVPTRALPRALRTKWIAVALVLSWLIAYEAFDLWSSPFATAMIVLGFIVVATAVDLCFTGASFCRSTCPIGQYQMLVATVAPREVRAVDADVCAQCATHDCLKGRRAERGVELPGCGLELLIPKKSGNLDCTFCLDCVSACPHDNVGVLPVLPGADLAKASWRSQIGLLSARLDFAALALLFAFGAIVNAAGMTEGVVRRLDQSAREIGLSDRFAQAAFVITGVIAGVLIVALTAALSRLSDFHERFARLSFALLPLATSLWLAHFLFHLVTGFPTAEVALLRVSYDLQWIVSEPDRVMSCCAPAPAWLLPIELLALSVGVSVSLGVHYWSVVHMHLRMKHAMGASTVLLRWAPGAVVIVLVWAISAWILFQPMEMRGTFGTS